ncbi:Major facilitator superfamily domain general substrate transporter [Penicillium verhagenii]|uniref:Major facilitator superfamily domain general substrate transporter n=1 Tax=Penicillium verhagenii TaxID=1562060 RepID=UPI002545B36E|nr:Major facilitator superfamily domain general substrate transporter [Penicillium verhagenii]KAJ5934258.1 Major facilitator superfamily domain general substrate transporter [Penicillium verhagenii]
MSDTTVTKEVDPGSGDFSTGTETPDLEGRLNEHKDAFIDQPTWDWEDDPENPYNWPTNMKFRQALMISCAAFTTSLGTSILTPAHTAFMEEFNVGSTVAILPLSLYVFALALGPVVGGPLSETIGRYPVYIGAVVFGSLFTIGIGFSNTIASVCILRFLAGFCFAPVLAIAAGTINETWRPAKRAIPSIIFILTPFLGPGIAPVIGSFIVARKGWRWTQWTLLFFAIFTMFTLLTAQETFHPIIKRRRAKKLGLPVPPSQPLSSRIHLFMTIALIRPVQMLFTEPIVAFICLYVACEFATLFSFFAAVPLVFESVYRFDLEKSGLIFLSIVVGCLLGAFTVLLCDIFFYRPKSAKHPPNQAPPELRLYPAMIGSFGLPIGLFWFGWTSRVDISWASPAVAVMVFAWGNLCVFIGTTQYLVDTYRGITIASAMSANSLARYGLAGVFPLFTIQSTYAFENDETRRLIAPLVFTKLDIAWASSLLGFIAIALLPVPWIFFMGGKKLRDLSKFEGREGLE